jgi:hypothetical protein
LSFAHHAEVAALPVKQQEKLLDRAEAAFFLARPARVTDSRAKARSPGFYS